MGESVVSSQRLASNKIVVDYCNAKYRSALVDPVIGGSRMMRSERRLAISLAIFIKGEPSWDKTVSGFFMVR